MIAAVGEVVAASQSWVYTVSAQEQDLFHAIATRVSGEELQAKLGRHGWQRDTARQLDVGNACRAS